MGAAEERLPQGAQYGTSSPTSAEETLPQGASYIPAPVSTNTTQEQQTEPTMLETANKYYASNPKDPWYSRVGKSLGRTALMAPNIVNAITSGPSEEEKAEGYAPEFSEHPVASVYDRAVTLPIKHTIMDPSANAFQHIEDVRDQVKKQQGGSLTPTQSGISRIEEGISAVPVVGPFILNEAEQAHAANGGFSKGDIAGTVTDLATLRALPAIAKESSPGGRLPGAAPKGTPAFPVTQAAADAGRNVISRASTPKNIGTAIGATGGSVKVPVLGTIGGGYVGGKAAEILLGPERANKPVISPAPNRIQGSFDFNAGDAGGTPPPKPGPGPVPPITPESAPAITPKIVGEQLEKSLGGKPLQHTVPLKEQVPALKKSAPTEPVDQQPKLSSRPDKAALQKAGATEDQIGKILPLTNIELRQLAINLGEDVKDLNIGRGKGDVAAGTHVPREQILDRIVKNHSVDDVEKAIGEGKHLPEVSGGSAGTGTGRAKQKTFEQLGLQATKEPGEPGRLKPIPPMKTPEQLGLKPRVTITGGAERSVLPPVGEQEIHDLASAYNKRFDVRSKFKFAQVPDNTLNAVSVENEAGKHVGGISMFDMGDSWRIASSGIPEEAQGTGFGQKLYVEAFDMAKKAGKNSVESGSVVSPAAQNAWRAMMKKGLPIRETKGRVGPEFRLDLKRYTPAVKKLANISSMRVVKPAEESQEVAA